MKTENRKLYNRNAERSILSACIHNNDIIPEIRPRIRNSEYFYIKEHQLIYDIILELDDASVEGFDKYIISQRIFDKGLSDIITKAKLNKILLTGHDENIIKTNIKSIVTLYGKRVMENSLEEAKKMLAEKDASPRELIGVLQNASMFDQHYENMPRKMSDIDLSFELPEDLPSLLYKSDEVVFGKGNIFVIAGQPGMGKTTFACQLAWESAKYYSKKVYFATLEMTEQEWFEKICSINKNIDVRKIKDRKKYKQIMSDFRDESENVNIITDDSSLSLDILVSNIRNENNKGKLDAVFVDYLQLLSVAGYKTDNEVGKISHATKTLKLLAKELNTRIFILSQLNRGMSNRESMRPTKTDLKGSSQIEQDAAIIMFLYRPNYYGILEFDKNNKKIVNRAEVIIDKNRFGESPLSYYLHFGTGYVNQSEVIKDKGYFMFRNLEDVVFVDEVGSKKEKDNTINVDKIFGG